MTIKYRPQPVCNIYRKAYFRQCSWHCLKTLRVCKSRHRLLIALFHWRFKSAAIRQPSTFDKVCGCRIYRNVYFKRCKWHRLKTLRVCLTQTSRIDVCACRARMQQFPKFILCSTVAFWGTNERKRKCNEKDK